MLFARNDSEFCHFERSALAQSEKSTEFKMHFDFVDTSLSYESSV